jgi:hypothetical protein
MANDGDGDFNGNTIFSSQQRKIYFIIELVKLFQVLLVKNNVSAF